MKKMLLIVNPLAGTRKANKQLTDILSEFNRGGYLVSTWVTQAPGDARKAAMEMAAEMDLVVCCGGDGTFHDTMSGLMEMGYDIPVGYIPAGSTTDFGVGLGLQLNPVAAARDIVEGKGRKLDLGRFGEEYFTYVASFGAFTRTSYATSQSVKNALGHTAYVLSGISDLLQIKGIPMKMELDSGEIIEGDYIFGAVCNSTSIGGIVKLNPSLVDMSDGLFEVFLVRSPKDLLELTECIGAVQKQQYDNCRMITFRSAKSVKITAAPDLAWTLDGEMETGHCEIQIENHQQVITLIK